jgi:hypothetical protein
MSTTALAAVDCVASQPSELGFKQGDTIVITNKLSDSTWEVGATVIRAAMSVPWFPVDVDFCGVTLPRGPFQTRFCILLARSQNNGAQRTPEGRWFRSKLHRDGRWNQNPHQVLHAAAFWSPLCRFNPAPASWWLCVYPGLRSIQ